MNNFKVYYIDDKHNQEISGILADLCDSGEIEYKEMTYVDKNSSVECIIEEFKNRNNRADLILLDYKLYENKNKNEEMSTGYEICSLLEYYNPNSVYIISSDDKHLE